MHIDRENLSAKFWIEPDVSLDHNYGYARRELREIERITRSNLETLKNEWNKFCDSDSSAA